MYPFFMRWKKAEWPAEAGQSWVTFSGIPGLPKKRWWYPRWRWQWPSRLVRLDSFNPNEGYYVYFKEGSVCMKTRWPVLTKDFTVRIGPKAVSFCAVSKHGEILVLDIPRGSTNQITPI